MRRAVEWVLAAIGALTTIVVAVTFAGATGGDIRAALILAAVAAGGFVGFVAVVFDEGGRSRHWGAITWLVAGALTPMVYLAGFSFGFFLLPAVLAFGGAAILADRRQGRSLLSRLPLYLGGALGWALLIVLINVFGRV
jgi:hypothetical protein